MGQANKLYLPDCLNWGHLSEKIFTEAVSKIKKLAFISVYYTLHSEHDEPSLTCLATGGSSSFKDFLLGRSKDTGAMAGSSGAVPPDLPLKVDRVQAEAIFCMK